MDSKLDIYNQEDEMPLIGVDASDSYDAALDLKDGEDGSLADGPQQEEELDGGRSGLSTTTDTMSLLRLLYTNMLHPLTWKKVAVILTLLGASVTFLVLFIKGYIGSLLLTVLRGIESLGPWVRKTCGR